MLIKSNIPPAIPPASIPPVTGYHVPADARATAEWGPVSPPTISHFIEAAVCEQFVSRLWPMVLLSPVLQLGQGWEGGWP